MSTTTTSARRLTALLGAAALAVTAAVVAAGSPAHATGATIDVAYSSVPAPLPANVLSLGFAATQANEFGDLVQLAPGTSRELDSVEVGFSSWACEDGSWNAGTCVSAAGATFTHPITVTLYEEGVDGVAGASIASVTKTVAVPYRPSFDNVNCTAGRWWDGASCSNGFLFTQRFSFASSDVTLPERVVVGVSFPTSRTAGSGLAVGGDYDSLNVAIDGDVSAGTDVDADVSYVDYSLAANYTDDGAAGIDIFRADTGWGTYGPPMIAIRTAEPAVVVPAKPTTTPPTPASAEDAIAESPNKVSPSSVTSGSEGAVPGGTMTFNVGAQNGNSWLYGTFFSDPTAVGWVYVSPAGTVTLPIPATLPAGSHTIVLVDASGNVVATVAGVSITALLAATGTDEVELATLAISGATLLLAGGVMMVLRRRIAARA